MEDTRMEGAEKYETPQITDHGDLTEVTAATTTVGKFDFTYKTSQPIPPSFGTNP